MTRDQLVERNIALWKAQNGPFRTAFNHLQPSLPDSPPLQDGNIASIKSVHLTSGEAA